MAKRCFRVILIFLALGAALTLGLVWAAPAWIEGRLKQMATEHGVDLDAKVSSLGVSGLSLALELRSPVRLRSDVSVTWDLARAWDEIPFGLRSLPSTRQDLVELPAGARLKEPHFIVDGIFHRRDAVLEFLKIEVDLDLEAPVKGKLKVRPQTLSELGSWRAEITLSPQNFSGLGETRLSLKKAVNLLVLYRAQGDTHHLELPKPDAALYFSWLASPESKPLSFSVHPSEARIDLRSDGTRPLSFIAKYAAQHPLLASAGELKVQGADIKDLEVRLNDQTRLKKWQEGDYRSGVGQTRLRLIARLRGELASLTSLSLKAEWDELQRKDHVAQEISLKAALRCSEFPMATPTPELLGASCRLLAEGLELQVGRIFSKQPIRGLELSLKPSKKVYVGKLGMEWQGARIESSLLELDPSLQSLRLELASNKLSLQELLTALDQPKLSGQGEIKGSLNMIWEKARGLTIRPAFFESTGPGILRYADPALHGTVGKVETFDSFQALLARGQQALVMKALEDFHYKKLRATVTRDPDLKLRAELDLSGANPALAKSQPFEIRIPIEGDLESLLLNSLFADFSQRGMPAPRRLPKSTN